LNRVLNELQLTSTPQRDDGALLAAFVACREEAAFAALVRRHGPMVLGVCRRVLHDAHLAEDAFQATFLVLARKAATLRQRERVANWLYGVAYRTALAARTLAARRSAREQQVIAMPHPTAGPDKDDAELRRVLDQELARLPDKLRAPLVLCDLEGRTRRDAARHLKLPESTLSNRLMEARRRLARRLTRHGFSLSAGGLATMLSSADAGVSAALMSVTLQSSLTPVGAAGTIAAPVALLTESVMKSLLLAKLKAAAALSLAAVSVILALGTLGAGRLLPDTRAAQPQDPLAAQAPNHPEAEPRKPDRRVDPEIAVAAFQAATADDDAKPRILKGHTHGVDALAFSPDGKHLASGSLFLVKIWDVGAAKEIASIKATQQYVKAVAFTPDGKFLATGNWENDTNNVRIFETGQWREVRAIGTGDALVHSVAVNRDSTLLATGGREKVLKIWDFKNGQLKHAIDAHPRDLQCVAFSKDGRLLATCGYDSEVKLWDAEKGQAIRVFPNPPVQMHWDAVAFSPDGRFVAACGNALRLLDVGTGLESWNVKADDVMTHCLAFSPDGKHIVTGGDNKSVKLWETASGKLLKTWEGHGSSVHAVAFSPDGTIVASGGGNELFLWPVPGAKAKQADPEQVEGIVEKVHEDNLVQLSIGGSHGLKRNDKLEVYRLQPTPMYIGQLRLIDVADQKSVGRMEGRVRQVKVNDRVARLLLREDQAPAKKQEAKAGARDDPLQAQRDRNIIEEQKLTQTVHEKIREARVAKNGLELLRSTLLQVWDHPEIGEGTRQTLLNRILAARDEMTKKK
jgi:RNA polymerase sigma factor (sigma-70 family)